MVGLRADRSGLTAVGQGWDNAEITQALHLSLSTVKAHLNSAQRKIGARNRVEVAVWAWRHALIEN